MQIGKSNHRYGNRGIRNVSRTTNILRNLNFDSSFNVSWNASGVYIHSKGTGSTASNKTFSCSLSGKDCTVTAGTLRLHSIGIYPVVETTIALSGSPCWVYVSHLRDHSSTVIAISTSEPTSTSTELMLPLIKCTLNADGNGYTIAFVCHDGDFNFDSPIM